MLGAFCLCWCRFSKNKPSMCFLNLAGYKLFREVFYWMMLVYVCCFERSRNNMAFPIFFLRKRKQHWNWKKNPSITTWFPMGLGFQGFFVVRGSMVMCCLGWFSPIPRWVALRNVRLDLMDFINWAMNKSLLVGLHRGLYYPFKRL